MKNNKRYFVESSEIIEQWEAWRDSATEIQDRTIPEKLGEQIFAIATHLLQHKSFIRYADDMKQEMRQEACLKCIKNLKNLDPTKGDVFAYLTQICWSAYITFLSKYYRRMNREREMMLEGLENAYQFFGDEMTPDKMEYLENLRRDIEIRYTEHNNKEEDY